MGGAHELLKIDIKAAMMIAKYWNKRVTSEKKLTPQELKTLLGEFYLVKFNA